MAEAAPVNVTVAVGCPAVAATADVLITTLGALMGMLVVDRTQGFLEVKSKQFDKTATPVVTSEKPAIAFLSKKISPVVGVIRLGLGVVLGSRTKPAIFDTPINDELPLTSI